jgi:hypothetical protein
MFDLERLKAEKQAELQKRVDAEQKEAADKKKVEELAPLEWNALRESFETAADGKPFFDNRPLFKQSSTFALGSALLNIIADRARTGLRQTEYRAGVYAYRDMSVNFNELPASVVQYTPLLAEDGNHLEWTCKDGTYTLEGLREFLWQHLLDEYIESEYPITTPAAVVLGMPKSDGGQRSP